MISNLTEEQKSLLQTLEKTISYVSIQRRTAEMG